MTRILIAIAAIRLLFMVPEAGFSGFVAAAPAPAQQA